MTSPKDNLQNYTVYGACAVEIELDVLTGTHQLRRADILEDTGVSISPDIDVGQVRNEPNSAKVTKQSCETRLKSRRQFSVYSIQSN